MKIACPQLGGMGRLGNQLFQLAATLGLAKSFNAQAEFPAWDYQPYFNMAPHLFGTISPDAVNVDTLVTHLDERCRGYLQDYNLFKDIRYSLTLSLSPSAVAAEVLAKYDWVLDLPRPLVGLHVRRGDNANEGEWKAQYHPLRPLSYYLGAHSMMKDAGFKSTIVFSDDIPWCKEAFKNLDNCYFFQGGDIRAKEHEPAYKLAPFNDWIDLMVMSWTDGQIISNSTYAWWAAFLSGGNRVIYPSPWFGPALSYIKASLMMPPEWTMFSHAT